MEGAHYNENVIIFLLLACIRNTVNQCEVASIPMYKPH